MSVHVHTVDRAVNIRVFYDAVSSYECGCGAVSLS